MTEPRVATIADRKEHRILLEGESEWLSFSKPEYRKAPFHDDVAPGDTVKFIASGQYISTIERVASAPPRPSGRDMSIQKQVALKASVELCIAAGVTSPSEILQTATKFNDWLVGDDFE